MVVRYHVSPRLSLVTRMLEVLGTRINHAGFNPGLTFYIARLKNVYVYVYVYVTYVYVYVTYVYVYVVLYVCIYIYIYLSLYLSICMYVCLSVRLSVYMCIYIYMWTNQPTCRQMIACVDLCNVLNAYHSGDMTKDYVPATTQNMANTRGTWQG
jgi:hypothetical protein